MADLTRNLKAIVSDIAEGFISVNPLFLKPYNEDGLKTLYNTIERKLIDLRKEPFPSHDVEMIRVRNIKLQRVYSSLNIIKAFARDKKFSLAEKPKVPVRKKIRYF